MSNHDDKLQATRLSWNAATRIHNRHKGDQAAFLRGGGELLFPEERQLLGDLTRSEVVHLQCNAGQDTLCLARSGAQVTGVDLSDEAIAFATKLSDDTGIPTTFICSEIIQWMHTTPLRFDVAFASYGALPWIADIGRWFAGVRRILKPGGRLVCMEFHPLIWSFDDDLRPTHDDYFQRGPFVEPVGDYVAQSGEHLQSRCEVAESNELPAYSWQHTLAEILSSVVQSGLHIQTVQEYPYSNGCRLHAKLVASENRRWVWPEGVARLPLMYSFTAVNG